MRNGVLDCSTIYDAAVCHCVDCMLPMAYEQRSRCHYVFTLFRIRCRFINVRIQTFNLSVLRRRFSSSSSSNQQRCNRIQMRARNGNESKS